MAQPPGRFQARSNETLQENLNRGEPAILASYGLIGSILLFGGAGYAIDRWTKSSPVFLLIGLVIGLAIGFYGLVKAASTH
jgi:F0F1-type ATP synthase assembly protein I